MYLSLLLADGVGSNPWTDLLGLVAMFALIGFLAWLLFRYGG
ncbi:hypothetical protein [Nocardia wallacei]|nr:hypothetical protein [Nocardia wallacei]